MKIATFAKKIPTALGARSGRVFYSGRKAFECAAPLYVLGVNPGGDPIDHVNETVSRHTRAVMDTFAEDWSAYRDESWEGAAPGTYGMAPRVLHLFSRLGFNAGEVPCSNLIFVRSRRENDIKQEITTLAESCWPFHAFVIKQLQPRAVLCFGKTAGAYVRRKLGADMLVNEFVEENDRKWRSQAFENHCRIRVVVATHPSIADWKCRSTDPTRLVRESLR
jgi:hypothetical protein